jgi:serine/threonine protein kinase
MADCQLCGRTHPDEVAICPHARTGQILAGKYTLGPVLGVGGIAAVYLAEHPVLCREIAVKILHKRFANDTELSARFVREARETAGMGHPAFVRIYDAGTTDDGCPYIEMDRLAGVELYAMRKAHGAFAIERTTFIAIGVLDALSALHARNIVHRDLKSQNSRRGSSRARSSWPRPLHPRAASRVQSSCPPSWVSRSRSSCE